MRRGATGLALLVALALGGCGGGDGQEVRWTPGDGTAAAGAAGGPATTGRVPGRAAPAIANASDAHAAALQLQGEIALPHERVERAYRVRFVNGPRALEGAVAELVGAAAGIEIVRGRIELGDLAPGMSVSPPGAVTLRHAQTLRVDPADLRWRLREHALAGHGPGRLLSGAPQQLARSALRDQRIDAAQPAPRLSALLTADATVASANEVLRATGLRIVEMRPGNHRVTLSPVAAGRAAALQRQAGALEASAPFEAVILLPPPAVSAPDATTQAGATPHAPTPEDAEALAACET